MTVTVPELKARADEIIRAVEREGRTVEVERDGKVIARIIPAVPSEARKAEVRAALARLGGTGVLLADPEESVWDADPMGER